jgi:uncharacterized protein with PQ loop repeat
MSIDRITHPFAFTTTNLILAPEKEDGMTVIDKTRKRRVPRIIEGGQDWRSRVTEVDMDATKRLVLGFCISSAMMLTGCGELVIQDTASLLVPHLQRSEVFGIVAGFGTTFAAVPDLIAMLRRRTSKGMNPRMAAIMGVFQILWVYYGLLIASRPVVLWNTIAVVTNFFSVAAYYYFAKRERGS